MKEIEAVEEKRELRNGAELGRPGTGKAYFFIGTIIAGYIGIYLCRKNFSVAIPLIQEHFKTTRADIGLIASYSTVAYALGKFVFGGVVDRLGGRSGFLGSLLLVALMGIAGGFAPTLGMLTLFYSLNRFAGAAGWPAMMKMTPSWFETSRLPFAIALLSLSFVVGGAFASGFAGLVASWSSNNWRAIMAVPSLVLLALLVINFFVLPKDDLPKNGNSKDGEDTGSKGSILELLGIFQFWIVCAMSFTLTLLRETFNVWLVDMIKTEGGAAVSSQIAAFLSTPFDICGAVGILAMGWIYGRASNRARTWLLFSMLGMLAAILFLLPSLFKIGLGLTTAAIGLIGFLVYGPYSLLAGTLSVVGSPGTELEFAL